MPHPPASLLGLLATLTLTLALAAPKSQASPPAAPLILATPPASPRPADGQAWTLALPDLAAIPLQELPDGRLAALIPLDLALQLAAQAAPPRPTIARAPAGTPALATGAQAKPQGAAKDAPWPILISSSSAPIATYHPHPTPFPRPDIDPAHTRGGYLHPLLTPGGVTVTDDYPPAHIHHHGVWWAWTKTSFQGRAPDFWNLGQKKGRVDTAAVSTIWDGAHCAGLVATHSYYDLATSPPTRVLDETWEIIAWNVPGEPAPYHLLDLTVTHSVIGGEPLLLPSYHYGGLGVRGHAQWDGKELQPFLTATGIADRIEGNATKARWCHLGGKVDGQHAGLAILDSPANFRHPQPMRLHPSEPFFCYAPQQDGDMEIAPGKPYSSRYRFVIYDGEPDPKLLDHLADAFSPHLSAPWIGRGAALSP